jgi:DNA invertase Pin-like site-specific DNA recombinase
MSFIGYIRVSTDRQAASGLGLDAQRAAIERYAAQQGQTIVQTYVEAESGRLKDRPQLTAALSACRRTKSTLLIAKLDRLARNVAFVAALMETGVEFIAVDAPFANRLMIHVLSAVAEWEREQISERTKAALAAAKARGVRLGSYGATLGAMKRERANEVAATLAPYVRAARDAGCVSLRQIASYLATAGAPTPDRGKWHASSVRNLLLRLEAENGRFDISCTSFGVTSPTHLQSIQRLRLEP